MFNYVPMVNINLSFVSNGGKFKLYTVLNGLLFLTRDNTNIIEINTFKMLRRITNVPRNLRRQIRLRVSKSLRYLHQESCEIGI
jgi:hypothetical protein